MNFNRFEILVVSTYETFDEFDDMLEKLLGDVYSFGERSGEIPSLDVVIYNDQQAISILVGSSIWDAEETLTILTRLMDSKNHVDFMIV